MYEDGCDRVTCGLAPDALTHLVKFSFFEHRVDIFRNVPRAGVWLYALLSKVSEPPSCARLRARDRALPPLSRVAALVPTRALACGALALLSCSH